MRSLSLAGAALILVTASFAQVVNAERTTRYGLVNLNLDGFDQAYGFYNNDFRATGAVGDDFATNFFLLPENVNPGAQSNGGFETFEWGFNPDDPLELLVNGRLNEREAFYSIGYEFKSHPTDSFMKTGVKDDRFVLEFQGGGSFGVDDGGTYSLTVNLRGRWTPGSGTAGTVETLGLNSDWTVSENWVFDGTNTNFVAVNRSFLNDPNQVGPDLRFRLYGEAVPEPATLTVMGLAALALLKRRRSA